jgi:hypothetical protein
LSTSLEGFLLFYSDPPIHVVEGLLDRGGSGDCVVLQVHLSLHLRFPGRTMAFKRAGELASHRWSSAERREVGIAAVSC